MVPVSYTHLDVYKRQFPVRENPKTAFYFALDREEKISSLSVDFVKNKAFDFGNGKSYDVISIVPVSYTHLDVYKRQSKSSDKVSITHTSKISKSKIIPELEEFTQFATTLEDYQPLLDSVIEEKYYSWLENDWKNSSGRPISNWKSSLKSILPYLKNSKKDDAVSVTSIPNIKRPKTSWNQ